jgi:two-component system, chemotaxis family, chemotaxis protein CheY
MRVLVVDDDEAILGFIHEILADEGYEVLEAIDGAEALRIVQQRPPDLILLDMRMPVMDGWQFAEAYRALPGPHAPLIVLTAARDASEIAAEIQAPGYLAKPFGIDELLAVVERHNRREPVST